MRDCGHSGGRNCPFRQKSILLCILFASQAVGPQDMAVILPEVKAVAFYGGPTDQSPIESSGSSSSSFVGATGVCVGFAEARETGAETVARSDADSDNGATGAVGISDGSFSENSTNSGSSTHPGSANMAKTSDFEGTDSDDGTACAGTQSVAEVGTMADDFGFCATDVTIRLAGGCTFNFGTLTATGSMAFRSCMVMVIACGLTTGTG